MLDPRRAPPCAFPEAEAAPALYAGLRTRRIFAYLVDALILAIVGAIAWVALSLLTFLSFGLLFPLQMVILACLPIAYHSLLIATRGHTIGMGLLDLEVVDLGGRPLDLLRALVMTLVFYVSVGMTAWLVLLWSLFDSRKRLLHDLLSDGLVLRASRIHEAAALQH